MTSLAERMASHPECPSCSVKMVRAVQVAPRPPAHIEWVCPNVACRYPLHLPPKEAA